MANNHEYRGRCDLCSLEADSEVAEVVGLDCSYATCPEGELYHQACLEKYLKSIRCERNRKIGFPCPRGCGKATRYPEKCKGKILKSHPVTIRSEGNKKRRQTEHETIQKIIPEQVAKHKGKKEEPPAPLTGKDKKQATAAAKEAKTKPATAKPVVIKALNVANVALTKLQPPRPVAHVVQKDPEKEERERIRAQVAAARQTAVGAAPAPQRPSKPIVAPAVKQIKTLDEYMAERGGGSSLGVQSKLERLSSNSSVPSTSTPAVNAWSRANSRGASFSTALTSMQSVDSLPGTPGRKSASSHSPSEDFPPAAAPAVNPPTPQGVWGSAAKRPAVSEETTPRTDAATSAPEQRHHVEPPAPASNEPAPEPLIPGMTPVVPDSDGPKLTKAQRKNLKRAEKKAAARVEDTHSIVSATPSHLTAASGDALSPRGCDQEEYSLSDAHGNNMGHAEECHPGVGGSSSEILEVHSAQHFNALNGGDVEEDPMGFGHLESADMDITSQCMRCIVQRKLQTQIADLVGLGFPADAATTAVANCGGNLEVAVMLLLGGEGALPPGMGCGEAVDISEELAVMQYLQIQYHLATGVIDAIVVDCDGDLGEVAVHLQRTSSEQTAAAAAAHAVGENYSSHHQQHYAEGALSPSGPAAGGVSAAEGASSGNGNAFSGPFGLPPDIDWGQAAIASAPAPAAGTSVESTGTGNGNGGGWNSLFGFDGASALSAVHAPLSSSTVPMGTGTGSSPHHSMLHQLNNGGSMPSREHYIIPQQPTQQAQQQHRSLFGESFEALGFGSSPPYQQQHDPQQAQQQQQQQQFASGTGGGSTLWGSSTTSNGGNESLFGSSGGYNNGYSMSNGNSNNNNIAPFLGQSYGMPQQQQAQQEMAYPNGLATSSWSQPGHMDAPLWSPLGAPVGQQGNGTGHMGSLEGRGGGGGSGIFPGAPQQQQGGSVGSGGVPGSQYSMEDSQLNELMATLMCR